MHLSLNSTNTHPFVLDSNSVQTNEGWFLVCLILRCRFEKLQEDAFKFAFMMKVLDMIPASV